VALHISRDHAGPGKNACKIRVPAATPSPSLSKLSTACPFADDGERVEVRGCASIVQILKDCRLIATHRRRTPARLVIDPAHYDGPSTARVVAQPPLGRMGAKMMELAPVAHRAIEFYAALAEVAR
jgi:hypothetical protein